MHKRIKLKNTDLPSYSHPRLTAIMITVTATAAIMAKPPLSVLLLLMEHPSDLTNYTMLMLMMMLWRACNQNFFMLINRHTMLLYLCLLTAIVGVFVIYYWSAGCHFKLIKQETLLHFFVFVMLPEKLQMTGINIVI